MAATENLKEAFKLVKGIYKDLKPFRSALQNGQKVVTNSFSIALGSINSSMLYKSGNENINKIHAVAKVWDDELSPLQQKDENFWINWSKINALDLVSTKQAKSDLEKLNRILLAIDNAIPALIVSIKALAVGQGYTEKTTYALSPSLGVQEYMAIDNAIIDLNAVQAKAKKVSSKITNVIRIL